MIDDGVDFDFPGGIYVWGKCVRVCGLGQNCNKSEMCVVNFDDLIFDTMFNFSKSQK